MICNIIFFQMWPFLASKMQVCRRNVVFYLCVEDGKNLLKEGQRSEDSAQGHVGEVLVICSPQPVFADSNVA